MLVSLILSAGALVFPMPCASRPNSLVNDVVHVLWSLPFNNKSIDCLAPVAKWYTGHAQCMSGEDVAATI